MANQVLVIGKSGTGKSRSLLNLDPATTVLVNVIGKPLPFKGWKGKYTPMTKDGTGNLIHSDVSTKILAAMKYVSDSRPEIKTIVVDDFQYIMANEFMRRSGETGYQKFTDIGMHAWSLITESRGLRDDLIIIILAHSDEDDLGRTKCKTIGKMLDDKICLEGMFSIVLRTQVVDGKYSFATQNSGMDTVKSPEGMFAKTSIDNDLSIVVAAITEYERG